MDRFVSSYTLRLDTKGRVSIPAPFRAVLARDGFEGLYCYPTLDRPALDAGGNALLREIEALIARFPPYSEEREQFSAALYGTSEVLKIDGEGRAVLTEPLKTHAGIRDEIACVGLGHKFQIWEPGRFRAELAATAGSRLVLVEDKFSNLRAVARRCGSDAVDGVVLDLGVSSLQLDAVERGFSFRHDGPLDMRMGDSGPTAADVIAAASERE